MKISLQKSTEIREDVRELLLPQLSRGDKVLGVALQSVSAELNERFLIVIKNESVLCAVHAKLMKSRAHLRRECEIGGGAFFIADYDPKFVDDLAFTLAFEKRADEPVRNYVRRICGKVLRDPGNPVANDILQQLSRQSANPMPLITEESARIARATELVTVSALQMYRPIAQEAALNKGPHPARRVAKLVVMSRGNL